MLHRALCFVFAVVFFGCAHSEDVASSAAPSAELLGPRSGESVPDPEESSAESALSPRYGAVSSAHPLATEAGAAMLDAGGSAFDASVAVALVLGVVNPQSSGLGGGGFAVYRGATGTVQSLDFREQAPSFFGPDTYADESRDSARGPWAVGVPGEPAGLAELHRLGGRLPWSQVVEPARRIAAEGFDVGPDLAAALVRSGDSVQADPGLRAVFAPEGQLLTEGQRLVRPALAETLAYLQAHGGQSFYQGPLAISFSGFLSRQGLPWTVEELASYRVIERPVLSGSYHGKTIHSMGPPSSGGLAILEMLGVLEAASYSEHPPGGSAASFALAQSMRHAFADRATYGGDPDFVDVPVTELTAADLGARLWAQGPKQQLVPLLEAGLAGEKGHSAAVLRPDDGGTSHLSVIDSDGLAVALTTTVNLHFGAKLLDPGTGLVLNDEMDDFAARPGQPNAFGLVQGSNNSVAAGKRPLSSMSPTLVLDEEGRAVLAVGGAGGPRIITGTLQTLLGVLDHRLSPEQAVAAPRIHHQWLPDIVLAEPTLPAAGMSRLQKLKVPLKQGPHRAVVHVVAYDPETDSWSGGADPRASGSATVRSRPSTPNDSNEAEVEQGSAKQESVMEPAPVQPR